MIKRLAVCSIVALTLATATAAAETAPPGNGVKAASKAARKPAARPAPVKTAKAAAPRRSEMLRSAFKPAPAPTGPTETLTCRDGTENRHARIGVILFGGKVDSFAYYSKWKPRTCSIYLRRNGDAFSKWSDRGNVTQVKLQRGDFLIERDKGVYRFVFRDIDRERYCGMDGTINGSLTVRKGSERCEVSGIMEEGVPLGQAWAHLEAPPAATASAASPTEPPNHVAQRSRRDGVYSFQTGVSE